MLVVKTTRQEDAVQDEPRKPGANAPEDPTSGTPKEGNTLDGLNPINVVQQNTVVIASKGIKRDQSEPYKSNSARLLQEARDVRDQTGEWVSSVPLTTDRLIADSADRLVADSTDRPITFRRPCLNIYVSRNRALERKSK